MLERYRLRNMSDGDVFLNVILATGEKKQIILKKDDVLEGLTKQTMMRILNSNRNVFLFQIEEAPGMWQIQGF